MKIGVFDSGVGGLSVAHSIAKAMPGHPLIYREDKENMPYGTKSNEELITLVTPILQGMIADGCDLIVIACNTITTTIIERLRQDLSVPLVGMEPMVKPAAELTRSGKIAVCATPATLASSRYEWLKKTYATGIEVFEPDCSDWALMIQSNMVDHQKIRDRINDVCEAGVDVIVLGCTHYHWIAGDIKDVAAGRATVIQPIEPVIEQINKIVKQLSSN